MGAVAFSIRTFRSNHAACPVIGSEFAHLSPHQIVPALADQGRYIASESTFYRVLRAADQLARRGRPKAPARVRPQPVEATGPNQVWSWDITYCAPILRRYH